MKVLYLTQWYPWRHDAMEGLFVRNHAEAAVRQGIDVCVLYCREQAHAEPMEIVDQTTNGVRELYVYYSGSASAALRRGRNEVFARWGKPDICQVNVLSKYAFLAYELYRLHHIPYVLVEHWSGYLPANGDYLRNNRGLKKRLYEHVVRHARCVLPVSHMLQTAMQACGLRNDCWRPIHNVVYDCFYADVQRPIAQPPYELLHVSCFDEKAKNVRGILDAVKKLEQRRDDFRLRIIGTGIDYEADKAYADSLHLSAGRVIFEGEKTPEEVCAAMQHAHLFVLFSRYETAGVVLAECMAVGLPFVATNVGGIPEMMNDDVGMLVESEDVQALTDTIDKMLHRLPSYHEETIRHYGRDYSYDKVGEQLKKLYESVLL